MATTLDRITCPRCGELAQRSKEAGGSIRRVFFLCGSNHVTYEIPTLEADAGLWIAWRYEWMRRPCGDGGCYLLRHSNCLGRGWWPLTGAEGLAAVIERSENFTVGRSIVEGLGCGAHLIIHTRAGWVDVEEMITDPIAACIVAARRALEAQHG